MSSQRLYRTDHNRGIRKAHCGKRQGSTFLPEGTSKLIIAACTVWERKRYGMAFNDAPHPLNAQERAKRGIK